MEVKRWRVFLDTSALIAGVVSSTGAAREVLRLAEAGLIELVISRQILIEADRNLSTKLPAVVPDYERLLKALKPSVVEDPVPEAVKEARLVIHHNDAPILAAARVANVDYLLSWNTKHFHTRSVREFVTSSGDPGRVAHRVPPDTPFTAYRLAPPTAALIGTLMPLQGHPTPAAER